MGYLKVSLIAISMLGISFGVGYTIGNFNKAPLAKMKSIPVSAITYLYLEEKHTPDPYLTKSTPYTINLTVGDAAKIKSLRSKLLKAGVFNMYVLRTSNNNYVLRVGPFKSLIYASAVFKKLKKLFKDEHPGLITLPPETGY